ncbi:MAG: hypothetical protein ABIS50_10300 [Luteolibacter sp.]|uniref:hypothetical protein n=1 Tax=Luteolibacter sp. TaxID=1962973 RepID=UPI0032647A81
MKRITDPVGILLLLPLLLLSGRVSAAVHPATVSPSGHYRLASESVEQHMPDGSAPASLGSNVSLMGHDGRVISKCSSPSEAYPDVPESLGREEWVTKAFWNEDETLVAVYSGGRIWSRIDFFSITQGRIAILPHPDWRSSIFKSLAGSHGETTRLYETFSKWTKKDTCVLEVSGTAILDETQPEPYPQFSYIVTLQTAIGGIKITRIKKPG